MSISLELDTAPCGFFSFGQDGKLLDVNQTLLEQLGYARDEVVGQHVEMLMPVGARIFYQTHWFPLLRMQGSAQEVYLFFRAKSGESVGMLSYAKQRDDHFDCVVVPVVERAKFEEELLRAKQKAERFAVQLEEQALELELQQEELRVQNEELLELRDVAESANRAKSSFLAVMSHELRTPLNAISGYLQILDLGIKGPLNDDQRDILHRLDQAQRHLLGLIDEVLNLSRIEAGQVQFDLVDVAVSELADAVVPLVEPQIKAKGLRLVVEMPADVFAYVDVDKTRQILINLLGNAAKFSNGPGDIRLSARREADQLQIDVVDQGIGIPTDKLDAVFEPFVQVDPSRTRTAQGSGLGLAISRDLARGMGGDLTVRSALGSGSTFTLSVPASSSASLPRAPATTQI